jgi:RNA polymerase sigma-32 factor
VHAELLFEFAGGYAILRREEGALMTSGYVPPSQPQDNRKSDRSSGSGLLRGLRGQPLLSYEEELELALRSRQGDQDATTRLVNSHLPFVVKMARKYRNYGPPLQDLVQEGTIGLLRAANRFDPGRDVRFATYAMWWVRAAIQDHVVRSWSSVRIGTTATQKTLFFKLRRMMVELRDGADALGEELLAPLAKRFDVPLREVTALAQRVARFDLSLNRPIGGEQTDGEQAEDWLGRLACERPNPEEEAVQESESRFWDGLLARALDALPPREQLIIKARYYADAVPTREAIGRELGISKERVRQLEIRALEKLRRMLGPIREGI